MGLPTRTNPTIPSHVLTSPPPPASSPDGKLREETFTCPLEPFEFSTGLWGHYLTTITVHFRAGLGLDKPLKARHYIVLEKGQEDDVDEFDCEEDEDYQQVRQQTTVLVDASGAELAQGSREVAVDTYRVRDPKGRLDTVDSYLVHQLAFGGVKKPPKAKSGGKKPAASGKKPAAASLGAGPSSSGAASTDVRLSSARRDVAATALHAGVVTPLPIGMDVMPAARGRAGAGGRGRGHGRMVTAQGMLTGGGALETIRSLYQGLE